MGRREGFYSDYVTNEYNISIVSNLFSSMRLSTYSSKAKVNIILMGDKENSFRLSVQLYED